MNAVFYVAAAVALISSVMVVTRLNAVHALLYLVVSLLAVAVIFYVLGAPFVAALEVIIYAGAIMMLFVFVIMMLTVGPGDERREKALLPARLGIGPPLLSAVLLAELAYMAWSGLPGSDGGAGAAGIVTAPQVGAALYGPYAVAVELASLLLLSALVGAYHLGRRYRPPSSGRDAGREKA